MPPDPSRAHRALDRIPTRNTRGQQQPEPASCSPASCSPSPGSYSPTSSEADALEASFYDYDVQSSTPVLDDLALPPVASSADYNYIQDEDDEEDDNTLVDAPTSLKDRLRFAWPQCPPGLEDAPFIVLWELLRVAIYCDADLPRLHLVFGESWKDQDVFWAALKNYRGFKGKRFPPKSDPRAWRAGIHDSFDGAHQAVLFTATLHPTDATTTGSPIWLELEPLKCEQSSRLFRRFGSDRFLEVRFPSLESWQSDEPDIQATVAQWLAADRHVFINRQWAAFYVRDRAMKVPLGPGPNGRGAKAAFYDRVLFFAEGATTASPSRSVLPVIARTEMLDWLLALKNQDAEPYLKLFHRVSLGLTRTIPAVVLDQAQILDRSKDMLSLTTGEVMNDGAGRISPSLMRKIRDVLGLQTIPNAIQGRLGSAKGMWLVDVKDHSNQDWIETYPKQRKWQCDMSEEAHRTLEVRSWSTELCPASLNIQFLPILEDRARDPLRMRATFVRNMTDESEAELQHLKLVLQHPELFRKWAGEGAQPGFQRLTSRSVPFLGGLPESYEDILGFLVDGGFEPMRLKFLQKIMFQKQKSKGDAIKEELKIKVAKSTYAYMLVDFWGVLEPGQVHLCFSSKFNDGTEDLSDLDDRDVLVARSPAHLPSDIQKVRAVFKAELRHLRDVVIFSSKGDLPLAAQLSGGDYDGDKAWVCWDPDIVDNFRNHPLPPKPDFSPYMTKDATTLGNLRRQHGDQRYIDVMLEKAFRFNLQPKYLGLCTSYKETFAYHRGRVSDPATIKLSWLLSELADQPKQGILFGQRDWARFRDDVVGGDGKDKNKKNRLPILAAPAYRSGGGGGLQPDAKHVIDYLMYAAKQAVDKALRDLHRVHEASGASHADADVAAYWDRFARAFGDPSKTHGRPRCAWFVRLRDGLRADVDACAAEWRDAMTTMTMRPEDTRYPDKVRHVYARWRAIRPNLPPADALSTTTTINSISAETARKFLEQEDLAAPPPDLSKWELLKASFAFAHHGGQARFVWQMAGRQLQAIKALAVGAAAAATAAPPPVPVVANMYVALRPDNRYIKRVMALEGDDDDDDDDDEDGGVGLHDGQQGLQGLPSSQETDF